MIRINGKPVWIYILAFSFLIGILYCAWQACKGGLNSVFWIFGAGLFGGGIHLLLNYSKGGTKCPECKMNFTSCPPYFCHNCGNSLKSLRCETCGVDWNFIASLGREAEFIGNSLLIIYCPGCGFFLNTEHYRKNSEPWYLRHKSWAGDFTK